VSGKERESLAELWTGFLERQAEEGMSGGGKSRQGSLESAAGRPVTRGSLG